MLEITQCPLCGSENREPYPSDRFSFWTCLACDMVYQSPRMTDDELTVFYGTNDYRKIRPKAFKMDNADGEPRARRVAHWIRGNGKFLDVGCAKGYLLQKMQLNVFDLQGYCLIIAFLPYFYILTINL